MEASRPNYTDAERAIGKEIEGLQRRAAQAWRGMEKAGIIELARSLDAWAVSRLMRAKDSTASEEDAYVRVGAAEALRPLLRVVKGMPGGVPWGPSSQSARRFAHSYLVCCGKLAHLQRMAALERYGLASTTMTAPGRWRIETGWGMPEMATREALRAWRQSSMNAADLKDMEGRRQRLRQRMQSYVAMDPKFLIRYDNDREIVASYREEAVAYGRRYLEAEAFPLDVQIGGRPFGDWKDACDQALGRILCHIDFAILLHERHRNDVALRDVLTIFAKRDDLIRVWEEVGLSVDRVEATIDALSLDIDRLDRVEATIDALSLDIDRLDSWEQAYETPTSFYIDLGRDFVLLPCFGALMNPYFALFRHLRTAYKSDWDRGVDRREEAFRSDLSRVFAPPRYLIPRHGFSLRRPDGSTLTDIDAIILDAERGRVALIQLKWHDVVGRSLSERESRRRNIAEANRWITRVDSWVNGRSSAEVLQALGVGPAGSADPPLLYVIGRYLARFSGETTQNCEAAWLSWPEILHVMPHCEDSDPLAALAQSVADHEMSVADLADVREEFRFPGLTIDLHVSSSYSSAGRTPQGP